MSDYQIKQGTIYEKPLWEYKCKTAVYSCSSLISLLYNICRDKFFKD